MLRILTRYSASSAKKASLQRGTGASIGCQDDGKKGVKNMVNYDNSRSEKTKRWHIPDKFINLDFANFLNNINEFNYNLRPIKDHYGSVDEWAFEFDLYKSHGITLKAILRLLSEKGCIEIHKKENYVEIHVQNTIYLMKEILARLKERE